MKIEAETKFTITLSLNQARALIRICEMTKHAVRAHSGTTWLADQRLHYSDVEFADNLALFLKSET